MKEIPKTNSIHEAIIEAPEYLLFGQNFFDQEPVRDIYQKMRRELDSLGEERSKTFLNSLKVLREINLNSSPKEREDNRYENIRKVYENLRFNLDKRGSRGNNPRIARIIMHAVEEVETYRDLSQYIVSEINPKIYNWDGTFKTDDVNLYEREKVKSYGKWFSEREAKAKENISTDVRVLVFGNDSLSGIDSSGITREIKKWRVLKASEILIG